MVEEAKIRITIDPSEAKRQLASSKELRQKEQAIDKSVDRAVKKMAAARARESVPEVRSKQAMERGELRTLELIAAGRLGLAAAITGRIKQATETAIGKERFAALATSAGRFAVRAAAVDTVLTTGFPLLGALVEEGITAAGRDANIPGAQKIADVVANGLRTITEFVQTVKAEISGTLRTVAEGASLAKGFALTGADFGKLPALLTSLRSVNVYEDKLEQDLSEAALAEGASNLGKFIREAIADQLTPLFTKFTQR